MSRRFLCQVNKVVAGSLLTVALVKGPEGIYFPDSSTAGSAPIVGPELSDFICLRRPQTQLSKTKRLNIKLLVLPYCDAVLNVEVEASRKGTVV